MILFRKKYFISSTSTWFQVVPFDPFGPFETKMIFLPQKDKVGLGGGALEQKINFCLKWSKWAQKNGQNGPLWYFGTQTSE